LALAFQPEDAVKVLTSDIEAPSAQRASVLTRFAERQRVHVQEGAARIAASGRTAGRLIAVSGVGGLIVAAICGWLVTRSVTVPLVAPCVWQTVSRRGT
jgi:hypothetical protein